MRIGFKRFDEDWVLPVDGTQGNKSRNLLLHRDAAKAAGFKRPEAVVVPWEYLKAVQNPAGFVLSTIDKWLPGWQRVYVRSDAPDEDSDRRVPGLYLTENIWHKDRKFGEVLIERVIESYDTIWAKRSRKIRGAREKGIGLLLERAVNDVKADYAGAYTEFSGASKILFAWPEHMSNAMTKSPKSSYQVTDGEVQAECGPEEKQIVHRLEELVARLPRNNGKGWEIEFVVNGGEIYAEQITPIIMNPRPIVPEGVQSIFEIGQVVGTGDYRLDGILVMPPLFPVHATPYRASALEKFDAEHRSYAVLTKKQAVSCSGSLSHGELFMHTMNARAFLITDIDSFSRPLSSHVEQYLRNTGIALEIKNCGNISGGFVHSTTNTPHHLVEQERRDLGHLIGPMYSPTKLRIIAVEASKRGVVLLNGPWQPFEALKMQ